MSIRDKRNSKNITKIYVTSQQRLTEMDIGYIVMSNKCYLRSVKRLGTKITNPWGWIAVIEYPNLECLTNVIKTTKVENKTVSVKRIYKSILSTSDIVKEPRDPFLSQIVMSIGALFKTPVNIRITNNRAEKWQHRLTKLWEEKIVSKAFLDEGIDNVVDIAPDGELDFCIVKGKDYIITYFKEPIDNYI